MPSHAGKSCVLLFLTMAIVAHGAAETKVVCTTSAATVYPTDVSTSVPSDDPIRTQGIPTNKIGSTRYRGNDGQDKVITVTCPNGFFPGDGGKNIDCAKCKPGVIASQVNQAYLSAYLAKGGVDVLGQNKNGVTAANQYQANTQTAMVWSKLQKSLEEEEFMIKKDVESYVFDIINGGTKFGNVRSGSKRNDEQPWKMSSDTKIEIVSSDTSVQDDKKYVALQFEALDFGENPENFSLDISGVQVAAEVRTNGASLALNMNAQSGAFELVTKVCPMLVPMGASVNSTNPSTTPEMNYNRTKKTIYTKSSTIRSIGYHEKSGGVDVRLFPQGMKLFFHAIDLTEFEGSPTQMNSGTFTPKDAALLTALLRSDVSEPCIDILGTAKTLRNMDVEAQDDCRGNTAFWNAVDAASTASLRASDAFWSDKSCLADSIQYCPLPTSDCAHADKSRCEQFREHCEVACAPCQVHPRVNAGRRSAEERKIPSYADAPEQFDSEHPDFPRHLKNPPQDDDARRSAGSSSAPSWATGWYTKAAQCNSRYHSGRNDVSGWGEVDLHYVQPKNSCPVAQDGCAFYFNNPWCEATGSDAFHKHQGCYHPEVEAYEENYATGNGNICPCQSEWTYAGATYQGCATEGGTNWCFIDAGYPGCDMTSFGQNWGQCDLTAKKTFYSKGHLPDSECLSKSYCRAGKQQSDTLNDADMTLGKERELYCQDKCKGYAGQPYKYVDTGPLFGMKDKSEAEWNALCIAQGSCTFLSYGTCYDDLSTLLAAQTTVNVQAVANDKDVEILRSAGLLCPNGQESQCGAFSLTDPPAGVTRPADMTCEMIPLLNPNNAANATAFWASPSRYGIHDSAAERQTQFNHLGCLAFSECDYEVRTGCVTRQGKESCVERQMAARKCTSTDEDCRKAAQSTCMGQRAQANAYIAIHNEKSYGKVYDSIVAKAKKYMDQLNDLVNDIADIRIALEAPPLVDWAALKQKIEECSNIVSSAYSGSAEDLETLSDVLGAYTGTDQSNRALLQGRYEKCLDGYYEYAQRKMEGGTLSESQMSMIEKAKKTYRKVGWAHAGAEVISLFCIDKQGVVNSGMAIDTASFENADQSAVDSICQTGTVLSKIIGGLFDVYDELMTPTPKDAPGNRVVYGSSNAVAIAHAAGSICQQSTSELEALNMRVVGCSNEESSGASVQYTLQIKTPSVRYPEDAPAEGGRRQASTTDQSCPPGSVYVSEWSGQRCYDAYRTDQYFEANYVLKPGDCQPEEINVDVAPCPNGLRSSDCSGVSANHIYTYDAGTQTYTAYSSKCLNPTLVEASAVVPTTETVTAKDILDVVTNITSVLGDSKCFQAGDNVTKAAIRNFHNQLGFCTAR